MRQTKHVNWQKRLVYEQNYRVQQYQKICKYNFHIFTVIYSSLYKFLTNQYNDQLLVDLLAQLVGYCTGITGVMGTNPIQAWALFSPLLK